MNSPDMTSRDMNSNHKARLWIAGARPRTLPAAIAPVLVGTSIRLPDGASIIWLNAILAMVVSVALQVGVNYANDYSDGIKGTDEVRVGPLRLVGSKSFSPGAVKRAAMLAFLLAAIAGLALAARTSWWLLLVGLFAIIAAWFYTGGKNPYGYRGLGEISVFIFFGLVATGGSYFVQANAINSVTVLMGIAMGSLSCALLAVNNLRDLPKDALVGKRTLAVRLGDVRARSLFHMLLIVGIASATAAMLSVGNPILAILVGTSALMAALPPLRTVREGAAGKDLIPVLGATGKVQLIVSALSTAFFIFY